MNGQQTVEQQDVIPVGYAISGVQKAATSSLHSLLVKHPQVANTKLKEWHVFDDEGRDWSQPVREYGTPRRKAAHRIVGDATPSYLFWPRALERMHRHDPTIKQIACFRDPVERAVSQWMMLRARQPGSAESFGELVRDPELRVLRDDIPRPLGKAMHRFRARAVVPRGFYASQLERAFAFYAPEQWLLLDFAEVVTDQSAVARKLTEFLDLSPFPALPDAVKRHVTEPDPAAPAVTVDDVELLVELFADELDAFAAMVPFSIDHWLTQRLRAGAADPAEAAEKFTAKARKG